MSTRGLVPNPCSRGSKGVQVSPSGGSQGSKGRLASPRAKKRHAPYHVAGHTSHASHESTPTSRGERALHDSPPTSHGGGRPALHRGGNDYTVRLGSVHLPPVHVHPMGELTGLLHGMHPPEAVHFSDEESYEEEEQEEEEGDGEDTPHGSNSASVPAYGRTFRKPFISCEGKKFGRSPVHRFIQKLINEFVCGAWISSKYIPSEVIDQIYVRFKKTYDWDPRQESRVKSNFKYVVQQRYKDIMLEFRKRSVARAINEGGHDLEEDGNDFGIMMNFVPWGMQSERWKSLCKQWNMEAWLKMSASGKSNRRNKDSAGNMSRHTGGSIGYDEHRLRLTAELGRPPSFMELFFKTHLDKASKLKYFGSARDEEGLTWCTEKAREAYKRYSKALLEKHGDDLHDHPVDDLELWLKIQKELRGSSKTSYIYGVGYSDLEFVVTGKQSAAAAGCSSHSCGAHDEVKELRTKLEDADKQRVSMQEAQNKMQADLSYLTQLVKQLTNQS